MLRSIAVVLFVCLFTASVLADNWPGWRGADGQGHCAEKHLPLTWSAKDNVRWKVKPPDTGNSTRIRLARAARTDLCAPARSAPRVSGHGVGMNRSF
jgi:hypothetical protein